MATLYLMMGCMGSGKSTWVKENLESDHQIWVSRDAIRFSLLNETDDYFAKETQTFNTFVKEICEGLNDDMDVYADATHTSRASRQKLLRRIPSNLYDEVVVIWVKADITVCLYQNQLREGRARVPDSVVRRTYYSMTEPSFEEGFSRIIIVDTKENTVEEIFC